MKDHPSILHENIGIYGSAILIYLFFYWSVDNRDYNQCELCDGKQYAKVYNYFETGEISQIKFPYHKRPLVPWMASLIPGDDISFSFNLVNFCFFLLGVWAIRELWLALDIKLWAQILGFLWMYFHWVGVIRNNLFDNISVDVPLYLFQSLALLLFIKKKHKWYFVLVPVALLQKESFLAIMFVLIFIHFLFEFNLKPWSKGKWLILATVTGIIIQNLLLNALPQQLDQKSPIYAILALSYATLQDPTRIVRWFAAFGSAFGILPAIVFLRFKKSKLMEEPYAALVLLSSMYAAFGLLAGDDMTRIIFLGFPFVMTLILIELQKAHRFIIIAAIVLSVVSLRAYTTEVKLQWAVDYAEMNYVWQWASYYFIALIFIGLFNYYLDRKKSLTD